MATIPQQAQNAHADSDSTNSPEGSLAPTYDVPGESIISIEHPCIVRNLDRGFKSLGGEPQIKHLFETRSEEITESTPTHLNVGVSLRPNDPFAKKIYSNSVATENILLKVTIPKRTGRKRKRGTDDPFIYSTPPEPVSHDVSATDLLRRLADNPDVYDVQPVGVINETHRFRTIPDLQMRADELPIMQEIRDHGMSANYESLKKFNVNLKSTTAGTSAFPAPPLFFNPGQNPQFGYQQHNEEAKAKMKSLRFPLDPTIAVPSAPPSTLPKPISAAERAMPKLRQLLERRPILTVDYARYEMQKTPKKQIEAALLHLAYYADSGPWKGAWIRYGVDPRTDPAYRFYQTMYFTPRKNATIQQQQQQQPQTQQPQSKSQSRTPQPADLQQPIPPAPSESNQQQQETNSNNNNNNNNNQLPNEAKPKKPPNGIPTRRKTRKRNVVETPHFDGLSAAQFIAIYQLCDITSAPFLADLVNTSHIRHECDSRGWGWYWNGTLAGIRVLMKEMLASVAAAGGSIETPSTAAAADVLKPGMKVIASYFADMDRDMKEAEISMTSLLNAATAERPFPDDVGRDEVEALMDEARRLYRFAARTQRRDMSSRAMQGSGDSRNTARGGGQTASNQNDDGDDDEDDQDGDGEEMENGAEEQIGEQDDGREGDGDDDNDDGDVDQDDEYVGEGNDDREDDGGGDEDED